MKLTTRGRFAVTALLDMALNGENTPINLYSISERQGISLSYLEQLFVKLRRAGIVRSYKGPGGGYSFAIRLDQVTLARIVQSVDEDFDARTCRGNQNCRGDSKKCLTHDLWEDLTKHIYSYLDNLTLKDLCDRNSNAHTSHDITGSNIVFSKNNTHQVSKAGI